MKQQEYIEGPEAQENFERFGQAILQAPKPEGKAKKKSASPPHTRKKTGKKLTTGEC